MSTFSRVVKTITPLSEEDIRALESISFNKSLEQGDYILKQGAIDNHLYFINKGMVRIYYLKDGREVTEWFAYEEQFFFSIYSYFHNAPSKLIIQCIEPANILHVPKIELEKLAYANRDIGLFYRQLLAGSLTLSQIRMESIQFETARQRYQKLLSNTPEILKRAPLKYIASYLGISFETLSRIRNQEH